MVTERKATQLIPFDSMSVHLEPDCLRFALVKVTIDNVIVTTHVIDSLNDERNRIESTPFSNEICLIFAIASVSVDDVNSDYFLNRSTNLETLQNEGDHHR